MQGFEEGGGTGRRFQDVEPDRLATDATRPEVIKSTRGRNTLHPEHAGTRDHDHDGGEKLLMT